MYKNQKDLIKNLSKYKKIFMFRVCGTGMGAAAVLLSECGLDVAGADQNFYPPMSDYLKASNIKCHQIEDIDHDFLKQFDLVVVGNVVPNGSDQAKLIEDAGVDYASFPAALGAFVLEDKEVVALSGTHGKTTTTYLATQVFQKLGKDPGYFIGGVLPGGPSAKLGKDKYFFIEADEYDSAYFEKFSKFRSYQVNHLVITSLEFDHADIFSNIEDIKNEFRELLKDVKGHVIFNKDYKASLELQNEFADLQNWTPYSTQEELQFRSPNIIEMNSSGTIFDLQLGPVIEKFKTNLVGEHNILNLTSVILFAFKEKFPIEKIKNAVTELSLVKRRQEVRGIWKKATVIDDFAHHPTAVKLTLEGIKLKYPDKKLNVIFEPHSSTARSSIFQDEFTKAFESSDNIVFTKPTRSTSAKEAQDINLEDMVYELNGKGRLAQIVNDLSELTNVINQLCLEDSVLVVLSNGTCLGLWQSDFIKLIKDIE